MASLPQVFVIFVFFFFSTALADTLPVLTVPLVDEQSFNFLGSLEAYTPETTVVVLGCQPGSTFYNLCKYHATLSYGPSTYALTVSDNDYSEGPTTITCTATTSSPALCITRQQQSTFEPITYSESVISNDLTSGIVTITAGAEKLGAAVSSFSMATIAGLSSIAPSTSAPPTTASSATPAGSGMTMTAAPSSTSNAGSKMLRKGEAWAGALAAPMAALGYAVL